MTKKTALISIIISLIIGITFWQLNTFSKEDSQYDGTCGTDKCCVAYNTAIDSLEDTWADNLENLLSQEKPASKMIDEGFENLRTYNCWLEYVCRSVQYSGYGIPSSATVTGLTKKHLGVVEGCQDPEDIHFSSAWNNFLDFVKEDWATGKNYSLPKDILVKNKLSFIPQCMTNPEKQNEDPELKIARNNYENCMNIVGAKLGCYDTKKGLSECLNSSAAFIMLETALRKTNADQKARSLEKKLSSIISKMLIMETHAEYLKTKLQALDSRYACYPDKCD